MPTVPCPDPCMSALAALPVLVLEKQRASHLVASQEGVCWCIRGWEWQALPGPLRETQVAQKAGPEEQRMTSEFPGEDTAEQGGESFRLIG